MGDLAAILALQEAKKMPTSHKLIIGSIVGIIGTVVIFTILSKSFGIEPFSDLYRQLFREEEETSTAIRDIEPEIVDVKNWIVGTDLSEAEKQRGLIETHQINIRTQYALVENYEDLMQITITAVYDNNTELVHVNADIKHIEDWLWILWGVEGANLANLKAIRDRLNGENASFKQTYLHYQALWRTEIERYNALTDELVLMENQHLLLIQDYQLTHELYELDWLADKNHSYWNKSFDECYAARKSAALPSTSSYGDALRPE